jgi:hypothetical protein
MTNHSNKKSAERIFKGVVAAYKDGPLDRLRKKYFGKSLEFANLKDRKIFKLENPFISDIDRSYEKYIYKYF